MMFFSAHNPLLKRWTSVFILLTLLLMVYGLTAQHAHAQYVVTDPGNTAVNYVDQAFNFISSAALTSLELKEWALDGVAFAIANIAIQNISRSIVEWINSGFQGSPAFVTDLGGFLTDVGDRQMGRFIQELGLGFMCSPFKLDVMVALDLQYRSARNYEDQCTLTDVINNVDGFFSNNALGDGGWESWFSLTTRPENNPYGALVLAQQQSSIRLSNAKGEQSQILSFGRGFLSFKECDDIGEGDVEQHCTISTPGSVIETQLNEALGYGADRLKVADEINEIIGALFAQLAQQVFSGGGGLLGLSQSGYSSNGYSYLEAATAPEQNVIGYQSVDNNPFQDSIDIEERYLELQNRAVSLVNDAQLYEQNRWKKDCSNEPFPVSLTDARNTAFGEIETTTNTLNLLDNLLSEYTDTNNPQVHANIYAVYQQLRDSENLHNEADLARFELQTIGNQYFGIVSTINSYESDIDQDCQNIF